MSRDWSQSEPDKIGISQLSWFITHLKRHWPKLEEIPYEELSGKLENLSQDHYMLMKRLYYQAFASGDGKEPDPVAEFELKLRLIKLGLIVS